MANLDGVRQQGERRTEPTPAPRRLQALTIIRLGHSERVLGRESSRGACKYGRGGPPHHNEATSLVGAECPNVVLQAVVAEPSQFRRQIRPRRRGRPRTHRRMAPAPMLPGREDPRRLDLRRPPDPATPAGARRPPYTPRQKRQEEASASPRRCIGNCSRIPTASQGQIQPPGHRAHPGEGLAWWDRGWGGGEGKEKVAAVSGVENSRGLWPPDPEWSRRPEREFSSGLLWILIKHG